MNNANDIRFRCSGLSKIMTDGKGTITEKQLQSIVELTAKPKRTPIQEQTLQDLIAKRDAPPELAQGVKTHLVDVYVSAKYNRREEITGKMLSKGNAREEDSITLVSLLTKRFYTKNSVRLKNDFIQGEWDLHQGDFKCEGDKVIQPATKTIDIKTSWSAHTFFRTVNSPLDPDYYWQLQGYFDLNGSQNGEVNFCLVNGIDTAIKAEKTKCFFGLGSPTRDTLLYQEYKKRCKQIEINHIFDLQAFVNEYPDFEFDNDLDSWHYDIPAKERLHIFHVERDQSDINRMHKRAEECIHYMNKNLFKVVPQLLEA